MHSKNPHSGPSLYTTKAKFSCQQADKSEDTPEARTSKKVNYVISSCQANSFLPQLICFHISSVLSLTICYTVFSLLLY